MMKWPFNYFSYYKKSIKDPAFYLSPDQSTPNGNINCPLLIFCIIKISFKSTKLWRWRKLKPDKFESGNNYTTIFIWNALEK